MHEGSLPFEMIGVGNIQNGHLSAIVFNFNFRIIIFHGQIDGTGIGVMMGGDDGVGGGSKDVWIIFVIEVIFR